MINLAQVKNRENSVKAKEYNGGEIRKIKLREGHQKSENYDYYVSEDGRVFRYSIRGDKFKEMFYHMAHGYKRVRITDTSDDTRRYYRVGRQVAKCFVPKEKEEYDIINHIDGDKTNDKADNLEWCNTSINTQHAYDNGLIDDPGGWESTPYKDRY